MSLGSVYLIGVAAVGKSDYDLHAETPKLSQADTLT